MADNLITRIFQKTYGYSDAQMAEIAERAKERAAERAEEMKPIRRSPLMGRWPVNEHSTLNHATQGTGKGR